MATQVYTPYLTLAAALGFLTLLLVLFGITIIRNMRFRIRDAKDQLRRQAESIDQERNRIAIDLHDELGPGLSAVGLLIRDTNETLDDPRLEKALDELQRQQAQFREIARDLSPRIIEEMGLQAALDDLVEELRAVTQLSIGKSGEIDDHAFKVAKSVHLYRLIKEVANNTIKHAGALSFKITFLQDAKRLRLILEDDGVGFVPEKTKKTGNGLSNIAIRVAALSGSCDLISAPGKGTRFELSFPITAFT